MYPTKINLNGASELLGHLSPTFCTSYQALTERLGWSEYRVRKMVSDLRSLGLVAAKGGRVGGLFLAQSLPRAVALTVWDVVSKLGLDPYEVAREFVHKVKLEQGREAG